MGTYTDTENIKQAEQKISLAIMQIQTAAAVLDMNSADFQSAAGDDHKNGNLKSQSQADQQNKKKQSDDTHEAADKDQDSARSAHGQYTEHDWRIASNVMQDFMLGESAGGL